MNAVEIEVTISALAEQAFDSVEFPFSFLQAFGNKETTIRRLRAGASNKSDLGGVLQTNRIHVTVCPPTQERLCDLLFLCRGKYDAFDVGPYFRYRATPCFIEGCKRM